MTYNVYSGTLNPTQSNPIQSERICMKFSGKVGNGPMNKWLNFGGDPDTDPYGDSGKRALAELCTVPVLLVIIKFRVSRRRREMYCGHARLCVCLSVCLSVRGPMPALLHGPGCNLGEW